LSQLVEGKLPCPNCSSSDAYHLYDDGHGYCYSCNTPTFPQGSKERQYSYEFLAYRGFSKSTMEFYRTLTKVDADGKPVAVVYPYTQEAAKVRVFPKTFYATGKMKDADLFGWQRFNSGQAKSITITEGEDDALAVYEMLGSKYPAVSVQSASSAKRDCSRRFDYLNSFDRIYICFDNDDPGRKAATEVAQLFDVNKVYHVKLDKFKDAQQYHEKKLWKEFSNIWWNARRFVPEGIISSFSEIDEIIDSETTRGSGTYPFKTLQEMTYGPRQGEVVLLTAFSGIGKTEILRAIEYHLIKTTEENLGIIHLEEEKERTIKGLIGYDLERTVHLPDSNVSKDDLKAAYRDLVGRDDRVHLYSHFGSDDPDIILSTVRFLAGSCNCKYVFLDHITMVVTGSDTEDERKKLDYISTKLAMMVRELDFTLFMVSHVNDSGQTRGSRNIQLVADLQIELFRDPNAAQAAERHKTHLNIRKNRFASMTGPAGVLTFNPDTFIVAELEDFGFPPLEAPANDNQDLGRAALL
jgi:twinkle protein